MSSNVERSKAKHPEKSTSSEIALAIKHLREDLGMTQIELASAIGIASTSIYRYEAGMNEPNIEVLSKLSDVARERAKPALAVEFGHLLWNRVRPASKQDNAIVDRAAAIAKRQQELTPDEQLIIMACLRMVRENVDPTTKKMFRILLEPWIEKVRQEKSWHRQHDRGHQAPEQPARPSSVPRKSTRKTTGTQFLS